MHQESDTAIEMSQLHNDIMRYLVHKYDHHFEDDSLAIIASGNKCDQTARLFVQYLLTYDTVNLPKSITNMPK